MCKLPVSKARREARLMKLSVTCDFSVDYLVLRVIEILPVQDLRIISFWMLVGVIRPPLTKTGLYEAAEPSMGSDSSPLAVLVDVRVRLSPMPARLIYLFVGVADRSTVALTRRKPYTSLGHGFHNLLVAKIGFRNF